MNQQEKLDYAKARREGATLFGQDAIESNQWDRAVKELEQEIRMEKETRIYKSSVGYKGGWAFSVGVNFNSALYKTKRETQEKLDIYLKTGKFDWYGSAE